MVGPFRMSGTRSSTRRAQPCCCLDFAPPAGGNYALSGNFVQLQDTETPNVAVPTEPVGTDFDFDARTNNFAAVNAYYHCDRFFRLVAELGFDIPTYFGGTLFPSQCRSPRLDHESGRVGDQCALPRQRRIRHIAHNVHAC